MTSTQGQPDETAVNPDQRLARRYRFADDNMDLFFMAALGWGPAGGLDVGQVFHVASQITDGDADSWVRAFDVYGDLQAAQAGQWRARGWRRAAGEARLKSFAAYRSAWQFAEPGPVFASIYAKHQAAFRAALDELDFPVTFFETPYRGSHLPGMFLRNPNPRAPVVLVIGGADTCFEDLFLSVGRSLFERGYSVAIADLPGQGNVAAAGLTWEAESERPIAAVIDTLVERFDAVPGRIALLGLSLGGYFVTRAAGFETRLGAVIASTPFPRPGEMFAGAAKAAQRATQPPTTAAIRSRRITLWKAGAGAPADLLALGARMVADPRNVTVPFLSIIGGGDSPIFRAQAQEWHASIPSTRKTLVELDAATGADGHCQVNNRLRLAQETAGWLSEIFA